MKYWLVKSEPDVYSIDDMKRDKKTPWDGVRNYQARNYMWKEMTVGDQVLFYHSNAEPTGVAGLVEVASQALADASALDKKSPYFDPKASAEKPIWFCVELKFVRKFKRVIPLSEIKSNKTLAKMALVQPGSRLSVQAVSPEEFQSVLEMENK